MALLLLGSAVLHGSTSNPATRDAAALLQGFAADELGASLSMEAACVATGPADGESGKGGCILQVVVASPPQGLLKYRLEVAVEPWEGTPRRLGVTLPGTVTAGAPWVVLAPLELRPDDRSVAVVLLPEAQSQSPWGGTLAPLVGEPLEIAEQAVLTEAPPLSARDSAGPGAPLRGGLSDRQGGADGEQRDLESRVVRIVPPRGAALEGTVRFDALAASDRVDRVSFRLDGEEVATDSGSPFSARLDLGSPRSVGILEAIAFDDDGRELGRDTLALDSADRPLRLGLRLSGDPSEGAIDVAVNVAVPEGRRLESVDLFVGEGRVGSFPNASFETRVEVPANQPTSYVRALARLDDGSSIDAVELLGAVSERVNVDLVEVFAVASDRAGHPLPGLTGDDFRLRADGKSRTLEAFGSAADVPLLLGVVIDSSGSMRFQMNEAKQAAGEFLGRMVGSADRAFLVDFDSQPRLARAPTNDLPSLYRAFNDLQPEGFTALYDSIVFSLLHFDGTRARRALVLLTDGDDYRSRFGPNRAVEDARRAGVPVYIVALGEETQLQRTLATSDLEEVAGATGGRVFAVSDPTQLGTAYNRIERELRNQYLLTFYAEPGEVIEAVEVEVTREGADARAVVGRR